MANPTTYFGWVMPTSTDLVTDLPADFNVFGQGVDTSMQDLLGGTTGQVLSKTSNTNMDFTWVTPTDQTPLTTKGDLFTFSTVDARLAVGTNGQTLVADSAEATGLKWATPAATTLPAFRAFPATTQTIPASTFTKVLFASETFDSDGCFASSRFTPTTSGYYQLNVVLYNAGADANDFMYFYKNGANYQTFHNAYSTGEPSLAMSNLMFLNGTTDYAEIYFYSAGCTIEAGTTLSSFSGVGIRS